MELSYGDEAFIANYENHRIDVFDRFTGIWIRSFGLNGTEDGQFQHPMSLCLDNGELYVVEYDGPQRIQVFT
jgi:hypothetical protein